MKLIRITPENLSKEHICCAISTDKDIQVISKKAWIQARLEDGLVFLKADVRGKCFIEYLPAEKAWAPIEANGYHYIDCLWVSGQYKGQGLSNLLLEECIRDSKEKQKKGLVVLSSKKKLPYLSDPKYLRYKGFRIADTANPSFELYYLPFDETAEPPKFKESVKTPRITESGFVLYYTFQCPFTAKYVPIIEKTAAENNIPFRTVRFETAEQAQNAPAAVTTYCLFRDGEFLTNEILTPEKLLKFAGLK